MNTLNDSIQKYLSRVADAAPILLAYVDNSLIYRYANKGYETWFGLSPEKIIGEHVAAVLGEESYKEILPKLEKVLSGKETSYIGTIPYKEGGERHIRGLYSPDFDEDENVQGFVVSVEDITELVNSKQEVGSFVKVKEKFFGKSSNKKLKNLNQELLKVNKKLDREITEHSHSQRVKNSLIQALREVTYDRDIFENKIYWSGAYADVLGYSLEEMGNNEESWFNRVHPNDVEGIIEEFKKENELYDLEYRFQCRDGSYLWISDRGVKHIDSQGRPERAIGTMINVTEHRNLQNELLIISEREQQRIGQDLHDGLGQSLMGLSLLNDTLVKKLRKKSIAEVKEAELISQKINEITKQTRQLAKGLTLIGNDNQIELGKTLSELALTTENLFKIKCHCHADLKIVIKDDKVAINLYRISQEAVNNAIKHSKASFVKIRLDELDGVLCLTVQDDGQGFLYDHQDTGKGMGMKIMSYRAQTINASWNVQSKKNIGTTVTCRIKNGCN